MKWDVMSIPMDYFNLDGKYINLSTNCINRRTLGYCVKDLQKIKEATNRQIRILTGRFSRISKFITVQSTIWLNIVSKII